MSFLGKIFRKSEDQPDGEQPLRNRTFSATQFREAELARAAESRARTEASKIDAAEVLTPAVNPVAETLMSAEPEAAEPEQLEAAEPEALELEAVEPEAIGAEPEAIEPQLEALEPEVLDPEAPEPEVLDPEALESEMLEPQAIEPQLEALAPEGPEPQPVEPEALEPETQESEAAEPVAAMPVVPLAPAADPMPWEEAVGWLSQRSSETRNFVGQYWNWDHDLRVLHFLAQQPDLDAGVAAHIFWLTAANEDVFPFGDDEPVGEVGEQIAWLTDFLGRRFAEGAFRPASYGFDDSWDCERFKQRLAELHDEGRIDWSPEAIPTSSQAELMGFDDIPEDERQEVTEFLARFGVY